MSITIRTIGKIAVASVIALLIALVSGSIATAQERTDTNTRLKADTEVRTEIEKKRIEADARANAGLRAFVPEEVGATLRERLQLDVKRETGTARDVDARAEVRTEVRMNASTDGEDNFLSHDELRARIRTAALATSTSAVSVRDNVKLRIDALRQVVVDGVFTAEERGEVKARIQSFVDERQGNDAEVQEERRAEVRAQIEARAEARAERQERLAERAQERVLAYIERFVRRMNAAIDRIERLADRLESRIEKLEAAGANLTDAKELLVLARAELVVAADAVASAEIAAEEEVEASEDPRAAFLVVRDLLGDANESVRSAHRALVEALAATKAATPDVEAEAEVEASVDVNSESSE